MPDNVEHYPLPENIKVRQEKIEKSTTDKFIQAATVIIWTLSFILVADMFSKILELGLRLESIIIIAIEISIGTAFTREEIRHWIFKIFSREELSDKWQKLILAIVFFIGMIAITFFVMPEFALRLYETGEALVNDSQGNKVVGISHLELSLQLQPGPLLTSLLPVLLQVNPNYASAAAAHYALGNAYEGSDRNKAKSHYQQSKYKNECYLYSYWRLGQIQIIEKEWFDVYANIQDAIEIHEGRERKHCEPLMVNFNDDELTYWLYVTKARAYIEEGKEFEEANRNLDVVEAMLSNYTDIQLPQFITFYFWRIKANNGLVPPDCDAIQNAFAAMEPHILGIEKTPSPSTNMITRISESKRIYKACTGKP